MKITKTASGKRTIKISRKEWTNIGKKAGWMKKIAQPAPLAQPAQQPSQQPRQDMRIKKAILQSSKETQVPIKKARLFFESLFNQLGNLPFALIKKELEIVEQEETNAQLQQQQGVTAPTQQYGQPAAMPSPSGVAPQIPQAGMNPIPNSG